MITRPRTGCRKRPSTWAGGWLLVAGAVASCHGPNEDRRVEMQFMDEAHLASAVREVEEFHAFFQAWFNGDLPRTPEAFARFESALDGAFELVVPEGRLLSRPVLIESLEVGHARSRDEPCRIWVSEPKARAVDQRHVLVVYEEWQTAAGGTTDVRISSALMVRDADMPGGWRWLHVHETRRPVEE